ncbi:hypothetical protein T440DRAFT_515666 [Plenodomus tracheiphilus IPT5]|uniref:MFS general substrate transporter n=1 Tax=Plenodomus tracheiphilus IPT5 TaxID=1408161 RepID=A0A6A7BDY1_9PLEO|nr:hypothetical protein T440DRAFT_515666 [Plenodomus tracheiphilus IPT5]
MAEQEKPPASNVTPEDIQTSAPKPQWHHTPLYNATILGICSLLAPGLWGAMNSLGAGGSQSPTLVNTANALTFCLMIVSCWLTSSLIRYIGIKGALITGTLGFAPYSAGLYLNNRYGVEWLVLLGAALCGISAGIFWASEAAIAIVYSEEGRRGRMVAYWITWTCVGRILGGAINLGLNFEKGEGGKVAYSVYLVFIGLQALGPFVAALLDRPGKVQRKNGVKVELEISEDGVWVEVKETTRTFLKLKFLLLVVWIGQGVYSEAVYYTYIALWFSVRARALGSFLSGFVAIVATNLLGGWLDLHRVALRKRARWAFAVIMVTQGAWWVWLTINVTEFNRSARIYDWADAGFGRAFGPFILLVAGFQLNYNFSFFLIDQISGSPQETIRLAALLRGTESAWQALSYGLNALPVFAAVGGTYFNFGVWAVAVVPAWLVVRQIGVKSDVSDDVLAEEPSQEALQSGVKV